MTKTAFGVEKAGRLTARVTKPPTQESAALGSARGVECPATFVPVEKRETGQKELGTPSSSSPLAHFPA
jgi:hypothetical protein